MSLTSIDVLYSLRAFLERHFMDFVMALESNNAPITFNVRNFSVEPFSDGLNKFDEFGVIYETASNFARGQSEDYGAINQLTYNIEIVFIDKGNTQEQILYIREALGRLFTSKNVKADFDQSVNYQITSTEPQFNISQKTKTGVRYNSAGIIIEFNRAI